MTQHTPGPWHWINPQTDEPYKTGEFRGSLRTVAEFPSSSSGWLLPKWILDMEEPRSDSDEENEANLRLIAAAPDLLEALTHVMGWIDSWSPQFTEDSEWPEYNHAIRAAIAKAEGRS